MGCRASRRRSDRAPAHRSARSAPSPAARGHRPPRRPPTTSSGSPARAPPGTRAAKTKPTDSAPSRRATNARTCAEAWSSHCSSSTRHTSGCSSATCDSRLSTARPIRNRSGGGPALMPNAVRSASRCGAGSAVQPIQHRRAQLVQPGERQFHLRLDAGGAHHPAAGRVPGQVVEQRRLAHARLAVHHQGPALTGADRLHQPVEHLHTRCIGRSVPGCTATSASFRAAAREPRYPRGGPTTHDDQQPGDTTPARRSQASCLTPAAGRRLGRSMEGNTMATVRRRSAAAARLPAGESVASPEAMPS